MKGTDRGRVVIVEDLCKGCGLCIDVCPPKVLYVADRLNRVGYFPSVYRESGCTGCGICFYRCPEPGAITVYRSMQKKAM